MIPYTVSAINQRKTGFYFKERILYTSRFNRQANRCASPHQTNKKKKT